MKEKNTLIILSPGFPAAESDTGCLPPIQQFCLLAKETYPQLHIVVVAFQYPFRRDTYNWHGVEVHAINGGNKSGISRLFTWMSVYQRLRNIKKHNRVIGVLSLWLGETALLGKRFSRLNRLQHFTWLQGQDVKKNNRYAVRVKPEAGSLIAISSFNSDEFQKHHGIKPFMIAPNGVNGAVFPELNTGVRDIDIFGAGSLIPLKNYAAFIRVVHALKKEYPHIQAVIAGAGEEERELNNLAFRLGLQHNLKLIGAVPHAEVLRLMNRSKIFLHTSEYEGMSTVMLEALYSGCKVVSFQPLSPAPVNNHLLCETEEEMANIAGELLSANISSERVCAYDMRDTVKKIIGLYMP